MTFQTSEFTATRWATAQDKAKFAEQFVRLVESDFDVKHFTDKFYHRLSMTFGNIAHYNRAGFWSEFFTTTADKLRFIEQTLQWPCYGDPAWTYSDVEKSLQDWLQESGILDQYLRKLADQTESAERAELARLQEKYG